MEDPRLLGDIYAAPYAHFEPDLAYVLDDGDGRAIGYVLGALDTVAFEARCEAEWWPALRARHPVRPAGTRLDDLFIHLLHHRGGHAVEVVETHPSHLHIDLLPEAQGAGWGRRMMGTLLDALHGAGSAGVHWGVSTANQTALGFYRHLGAAELTADELTVTFGVRL